MENHPIPQDVTGFQFKLIGEMTVKQFAYLAAGIVIAWITFALPFPWFIKYPVILVSAGLGVALAFLPVEGRPFDVMFTNFLKALFAPNQFVFQKSGYPIIPVIQVQKVVAIQKDPQSEKQKKDHEDKLQKYLSSLPTKPKNSLDEKEMRFLGTLSLNRINTNVGQPLSQTQVVPTISSSTVSIAEQPVIQLPVAQSPTTQKVQPAIPTQPTPQLQQEAPEEKKNEALEKEAQILQQELATAKQKEVQQQNTPQSGAAHEKVAELEKELSDILSQKGTLQNQLVTLRKELEMQKQKVFSPSVATGKAETQNVRSVPKALGKAVGVPLTPDVPNLLTGVVKDSRENSLPNILVEVMDTGGNPVRAFKTNGLGQFAAATPLPNGTYTLSFEDPNGKHSFDAIQLPMTGVIVAPFEVISIDQREQLRQELFKS